MRPCAAWRKTGVNVQVVVHSKTNLFQIGLALRPASCLSNLLHRWQQQRNQDGNYGNHYQKFDEREAVVLQRVRARSHIHSPLQANHVEKQAAPHKGMAVVTSERGWLCKKQIGLLRLRRLTLRLNRNTVPARRDTASQQLKDSSFFKAQLH